MDYLTEISYLFKSNENTSKLLNQFNKDFKIKFYKDEYDMILKPFNENFFLRLFYKKEFQAQHEQRIKLLRFLSNNQFNQYKEENLTFKIFYNKLFFKSFAIIYGFNLVVLGLAYSFLRNRTFPKLIYPLPFVFLFFFVKNLCEIRLKNKHAFFLSYLIWIGPENNYKLDLENLLKQNKIEFDIN